MLCLKNIVVTTNNLVSFKMIAKYVVLLCLFKIISCKIAIDIRADRNIQNVTLTKSGFERRSITKEDMRSFGISKEKLKDAIETHYGRRPDDVYLNNPTPWGDLYNSYKWEPVSMIMMLESETTKRITTNPVVISTQNFENFSNNTIKVNTGISQTVENSVTCSWSRTQEFSVSQEIDYDINIIFAKLEGDTGFSFTSSIGRSEERVQSVTLGSTVGMEAEIPPGKALTAVLTANRGVIEFEMVYKIYLRGNLAINFSQAYKNHHFWAPSIDSVMRSGGISNKRLVTQVVKINFYSEGSLKVYDKHTSQSV